MDLTSNNITTQVSSQILQSIIVLIYTKIKNGETKRTEWWTEEIKKVNF